MTGYALSSTKKEAEAKLKTALGLILFGWSQGPLWSLSQYPPGFLRGQQGYLCLHNEMEGTLEIVDGVAICDLSHIKSILYNSKHLILRSQ